MNILDNAKFYNVAPQTTGSTDEQSVVIDSAGYDNVAWIATADGNTNSTGGHSKLYHQHSDSTSTTDMVSCTGADYIVEAATTALGFLDNTMMVLDVHRPSKRYVSAYLTKDSTNAFDSEIHAILYNVERGPVTQPTSTYGVAASAFALSPTT